MAASKSSHPPWIRSMRSSAPTASAPAASASAAFSPTANTMTRAVLPVPCGRLTVPRTIWSALRGSTPRRTATSTVASILLDDVSFASFAACSGLYSLSKSIFSAAARYALLRFAISSVLTSHRSVCLACDGEWFSSGLGLAGPPTLSSTAVPSVDRRR